MSQHEDLKILISAYFDGEATPEEAKTIKEHILVCSECQKYWQELSQISGAIKQWPSESLSPDVKHKIQRKMNERFAHQEETGMKSRMELFRTVGLALVAVFVITLFMQSYSQRAIQARVRAVNNYTPNQTLALGTTKQYEPYYSSSTVTGNEKKANKEARLKSAADDIGDQYSVGNTDVAQPARQSEPSYASSSSLYDTKVPSMMLEARVVSPDHAMNYLGATQNTEQYDTIQENGFFDSQETPLSTLSIDVDTASYANLRRFLTMNQMPPKDSVRIEEMINYFSYQYPQPSWGQPFSINLEHGDCPWNPRHQLVLVGLQGKQLSARETPASNLVFLIDVSGSMNEPNKLPLIQDAFKMMVQQLRPEERISIVVYAGNAGLVLDSAPGYDKTSMISAINSLQAGGSTAGGQGIQLAYAVAQRNFIKNGNNRVILATDGDFNVGVSDDNQLVQLIEQYRNQGIFLTVLGVGTGNYKDAKMQKLADKGNGNYYYLDTLNEAHKVLVEELGSTIFTIAKDVKIQVEFNPATVQAYRLIGYEKRLLNKEDFNDDTKDAGELGAGHTVTALYEIVPTGSWENTKHVDPLKYQKQKNAKPVFGNSNELLTVKLRYKNPNEDTSRLLSKVLTRKKESLLSDIFSNNSDNLNFASAVAEFGMLLRDSQHKGMASYSDVQSRVQRSLGYDPYGYRLEFLSLVERAAQLDPQNVQAPQRPVYFEPYDYPVSNQAGPQGYNQKGE